MGFRKEPSPETKFRDLRRGARMNSSVPVAIDWLDAQGTHNRLEAKTRIVSPYGCLVVLPENLALDQKVEVINMTSKQKCPGSVVWHGKERVEGFEIGIELRTSGIDFWGLEL
jgi:hypothetical protein